MKLLNKILGIKKDPDFINDRRDSKRYDLALKLRYAEPSTKTISESCTKNISRNGLRFPVNSKLTRGSIVDIDVEDPNSDRFLSLKGRVMWLEELASEDDSGSARYETGINLLKKALF
ncbi:MAG: PilZ domain-containing protein [Candidatus Omnitrophota bacterium]|nr:PilZ domain-containing protein [Candidatus Omnitrophota bacterium]